MKPTANYPHQIAFRVDADTLERVQDACKALNMDRSDFLRLAVDRLLEALPGLDRKALGKKIALACMSPQGLSGPHVYNHGGRHSDRIPGKGTGILQ